MEPAVNKAAQPALAAALERLWARFLPEIRERISILESAAHSLAAGSLAVAQREAAHAAAHKLAGTLGTFNLPRGTELARELELAYESAPDSSSAPRLAGLTSELRSLVDSRK
jgi:HPt (histidine-containing phosphotransfer) domain-containing protein